MLALPALRDALAGCAAPVVAVSPVIGAESVKGPTAKMMGELGHAVSVRTVAEHYAGLIDGLVIDHADGALGDQLDPAFQIVTVTSSNALELTIGVF